MNKFNSLSLRLGKKSYPYFWLIPVFGILSVIILYPWLWAAYLSFFRTSPLRPQEPVFVGIHNYISLWSNPRFLHVLGRTFVLAVSNIILSLIIALPSALILDSDIRGKTFYRMACMLPYMLTPVVVGLLWRTLLHDQYGLVNYVLVSILGIRRVGWLSDPSLSLLLVIILQTWKITPFLIIILLSSLQTLPIELKEAARIDGADNLQMFWYITFPWLKPAITVGVVFLLIYSLRVFAIVYSFFGGSGPGQAAEVLGVYLYDYFRITWEFGMTGAISYSLLIITFLISLFIIKFFYREGG